MTVQGSYRVLFELARGGMGRVDLACRKEGAFTRLYAIKRLHDAKDAELARMLAEEARLLGLLRHANVVSVVDYGEDASGPFLVMEYVDGMSVAALAARAREPMPMSVVCRIVLEAARGLSAIHALRDVDGRALDLVHRDVSPQNLLLGWDGVTRVGDLGIAKAHAGSSARTRTGLLKGRMAYMAPERLRFQPIDRRADLFALGVVLAELTAGTRLYARDGDEAEVARAILEDPVPDLGMFRNDVPPAVVELAFRLLAKSPEDRPGDAGEVAAIVEAALVEVALRDGDAAIGVPAYLARVAPGERDRAEAQIAVALRSARPTRRRNLVAGVAGAVSVAAIAVALATRPSTDAPAVTATALVPPASERDAAVTIAQPAPPPQEVRRPPAASAAKRRAAPAKIDCTDPFTYDARGRKLVRRECF